MTTRRICAEASIRSADRAAMAKPGRMHNKVAGAPDYDDPEFWDFRFATGRDVGEWLNSGEVLLDEVLSDLERRPDFEGAPRILHLGPGVSQLGMKLRDAFTERDWMGSGIVVSLIRRIAHSRPRARRLLTRISPAECRFLRRSRSHWSRS